MTYGISHADDVDTMKESQVFQRKEVKLAGDVEIISIEIIQKEL